MDLRTLRRRRAALQLRRAVHPWRAWARLSDITRGARRRMAAVREIGRVERFSVYTSTPEGAAIERLYRAWREFDPQCPVVEVLPPI